MHRRIVPRRNYKGRTANVEQDVDRGFVQDRRDLARISVSEQRKSIKEIAINQKRNLASIVDQQNDVAGPSGNDEPQVQDAKGRKAALMRWKEQKALRLKLQKESEKVRPRFKLPGKIVYKNPAFLCEPIPPPAKVQPEYSIVTRSRAAAVAPSSTQKELFAKPTGIIKTKSKALKAKRENEVQPSSSNTPKTRVSFAPDNHVFVPPIGLSQYQVATVSVDTVPQDNVIPFNDIILPMEIEENVKIPLETIHSVPCTPELELCPRLATPLQDISKSQNVTLTRGSGSRRKRERKSLVFENADAPIKSLDFVETIENNPEENTTNNNSDQAVEVGQVQLTPEYFHQLVKTTTETLRTLSSKWYQFKDSNENIPEDGIGLIMTTVGQTEILITSKFKQFTGLVNDCQNGSEQLVTITDLQGFWDMVQYQVDDVQKKFAALEKLHDNNWVSCEEVEVKRKKVVRKKVQAASGTRHSSDAKKRIAELRAKKRALQNPVTPRRSSVRLKRKSSIAPTPKEMQTPVVTSPLIESHSVLMDSKSDNLPKSKDDTPVSKRLTELFSPLGATGGRSLRSRSTNLIRFSDVNLPAPASSQAASSSLAILDED